MEIPNREEAVSNEDEAICQRLIEVDENAKRLHQENKKRKKLKLLIWGILIFLIIIFITSEYCGKTSLCNKINSITDVEQEKRPADNKVVPMPYGGKSPMLISGNDFKEQVEQDINQIPPPPDETPSNSENKVPEWFNETAKK